MRFVLLGPSGMEPLARRNTLRPILTITRRPKIIGCRVQLKWSRELLDPPSTVVLDSRVHRASGRRPRFLEERCRRMGERGHWSMSGGDKARPFRIPSVDLRIGMDSLFGFGRPVLAPPPKHGKMGVARTAFSRLYFSHRTGGNPMGHGRIGLVAQVSIPAQRQSKLVSRITQDANRVDFDMGRHFPVGGELGRGSKRIGRNDATKGDLKNKLVAPSAELLVPSPPRHCIESRGRHARHDSF